MIKKEIILAFVFLFINGNYKRCNVRQKDNIRKQLFDLNWKFKKGNLAFAAEVNFNDHNWRRINLPHNWINDKEPSRRRKH